MKSTVISLVGVLALLGIGIGGAFALRTSSKAVDGTVLAASVAAPRSAATGGAQGALAAAMSEVASAGGTGGPDADGLIFAREYRHQLFEPTTGISLFWQNDDTTLYVGLISPGTGWAAVGFGKRTDMTGANILIGCVRNGVVTIEDHHGVSRREHRKDRECSLLAVGGTELAGETTLEFAIPLASGDPEDVDLAPGGTINVILARNETKDGLFALHTCCGETWIPLD